MWSSIVKFFKDSLHEFRHVVFPTQAETRQYFVVVVSCIVTFGVFLFIAGSIFSLGMTSARTVLHPIIGQKTVAPASSDNGVQLDQDAIDKFKARTASGTSTASGTTNSASGLQITTETMPVTASTGTITPTVTVSTGATTPATTTVDTGAIAPTATVSTGTVTPAVTVSTGATILGATGSTTSTGTNQ